MSKLDNIHGKVQVTGDIGEALDKDLAKAKSAVEALRGKKEACKDILNKTLPSIGQRIRDDHEGGVLDGLDAKGVFDYVFKVMGFVGTAIENAGRQAESNMVGAEGLVQGITASLEVVQKHHTNTANQLRNLVAAAEEAATEAAEGHAPEEPPVAKLDDARERRRSRRPGEHPGESPLDGRRSNGQDAGEPLTARAAAAPAAAPAPAAPVTAAPAKPRRRAKARRRSREA